MVLILFGSFTDHPLIILYCFTSIIRLNTRDWGISSQKGELIKCLQTLSCLLSVVFLYITERQKASRKNLEQNSSSVPNQHSQFPRNQRMLFVWLICSFSSRHHAFFNHWHSCTARYINQTQSTNPLIRSDEGLLFETSALGGVSLWWPVINIRSTSRPTQHSSLLETNPFINNLQVVT